MRACAALTYEPAARWQRLQQTKHEFFFEDLDQLMKERHRQFLEELMGYERQCFLNAHPYERSEQRIDQADDRGLGWILLWSMSTVDLIYEKAKALPGKLQSEALQFL